ncbi:MAG: PEGA domain-containing protein [Deltaproteobacteria bacterium]|nr:PEGA domain-containing protein [Deltaproteobacteria bacterium]
MNLKRVFTVAALLCITFLLDGCGVLLHQLDKTNNIRKEYNPSKTINIDSSPAGAEVSINNRYIGTTPLQYNLSYTEIQEWNEKEKMMLTIGTLMDVVGAGAAGFFITATKVKSTVNNISIVSLIGFLGAGLVDVVLLGRDTKSEKKYKYEPRILPAELKLSGYKTETFELDVPKSIKDIKMTLRKSEDPKSDSSVTPYGCGKDTDCKGDRICVKGECQWPFK